MLCGLSHASRTFFLLALAQQSAQRRRAYTTDKPLSGRTRFVLLDGVTVAQLDFACGWPLFAVLQPEQSHRSPYTKGKRPQVRGL